MPIKNFDNFIRKTVNMFVHPVWFIIRNNNYVCPCVNKATNVPKKGCKICFGTGNKLKLNRVMASNQNLQTTFRGDGLGFSEKDIVNVYYTKDKTDIKVNDIVVDHGLVDIVTDIYYERSDSIDIAYWRIETMHYKYQPEKFYEVFKDTLKEAGYSE